MLSREQAAAVEQLIFPRVEQQTSGQLRAALARAILAADPEAARKRRDQAQREARVLRWREDAGTAALSGRDLPSAEVLAADQRISARVRELKSAGLAGTMDELRARAYLDSCWAEPACHSPAPATRPRASPPRAPQALTAPAEAPPVPAQALTARARVPPVRAQALTAGMVAPAGVAQVLTVRPRDHGRQQGRRAAWPRGST